MKIAVAVLITLIGGVSQHGQSQQLINVPEVSCNPILVDGNFARDEWRSAAIVKVADSVNLYFQQLKGHVFIGVKTDTPYPAYVDMFLLTGGNELYNLHASMQIGERLLTGSSWTDREPAWRWGNHVGWIANETKYDATKDSSLPPAQRVFLYEGKEFHLIRSRFPGKQWRLRVEVRAMTGSSQDIVYPNNSERTSTTGWAKLQL